MNNGKRITIIALSAIAILIIVTVVGVVIYNVSAPKEMVKENLETKTRVVEFRENSLVGETEMTMEDRSYVENQVVAVAESKREAKKIAKAIGGELLSYDNQMAIIQIGVTVEEMMQMLEDDPSLPKVYPNYQDYTTF